MTSRVSILIPAFNVADVVAETLESALSQPGDVEVMAIDDGSTDGTRAELARFSPRLKFFGQENQGASATRNRLLDMAQGDWLIFLDADDVLLPGMVERSVEVALKECAEVVCSDWQPLRRDEDGAWRKAEAVRVGTPASDNPALAVFQGWWAPPGAVLVSRSLARRVGGFRLDLPVIQDARFLFDLARAGASFATTDAPGLLYRERPGVSLSRRDSGAFWRDCLLNTEQVEESYASEGALNGEVRERLLGGFELAARSLGPNDADVARRALAGARRQTEGGLRASRWLRLALASEALFGPRVACRISALFGRRTGR